MKNRKWNKKFPEVPEHVHQVVLSTLDELDNREVKRVRRMKMKKRTIVILAAAIIAILGTTVSASEIFKWNDRATEIFKADEDLQKELVMDRIAQEEYQVVSDAGLTIRAVQTIQDVNCFYALFEIIAEDDSIQIVSDNDMSFLIDYQGKEDPFSMLEYGFVDENRQKISNSRYFEIFGTKADANKEDLNMKINFTSLNAPGEKALTGEAILEGNWEFILNLHAAETIHYDINQKYQIAGCTVLVKEIELTPISLKLICDETDARELEKLEGVNIDQVDSLHSLYINGIKYKDGTIIKEEGYQELSISCGSGNYEKVARLSNAVDVEKIDALLVGDNNEEIKLP